jgi:hypothetical protein
MSSGRWLRETFIVEEREEREMREERRETREERGEKREEEEGEKREIYQNRIAEDQQTPNSDPTLFCVFFLSSLSLSLSFFSLSMLTWSYIY